MSIFDRKDDKGSAAASPKADFSNVQGGSSSTAREVAPAPADTAGAAGEQSYTVVAGDSLSKIAKREYGDASHRHRVINACSNSAHATVTFERIQAMRLSLR